MLRNWKLKVATQFMLAALPFGAGSESITNSSG
jgi:hypothetical protein